MAVLAETMQVQRSKDAGIRESKLKSYHKPRTPRKVRKLHAISQIRKRIARGQKNKQIMESLDLPERTYFRYLAQAYDTDAKILQQDKAMLALEIMTLRDRLLGSYRRLLKTASDEQLRPRDRLAAEAGVCEVAIALAKLAFEGPIILKDYSDYL